MSPIFHSITIFFIESAQPRLAGRILDFRWLSCSDGSGKYQNKEKPLKRQKNSDYLHACVALFTELNQWDHHSHQVFSVSILWHIHGSKIPGQPRDELQPEEEESSPMY